tara:strand:+ start:41 stop:571 length:531 start_codon:yes stop_codon:yes gene_type:complete
MERKANDNELNLYTLEQDDVEDSKNPFSSILSMLDEKLTDILNTDEENINSSEEEEEEEEGKEPITLDQSRLFKKKIIEQRTELEKLYDKKEKYKLQTEKLREENQELHEKIEALTEEIKELKEEKEILDQKCGNLTKDNEGSSSKNEILERRVDDLTKTISELYGILRMSKELRN